MRQHRRSNLADNWVASALAHAARPLCALLLAALPGPAIAQTRLPPIGMPAASLPALMPSATMPTASPTATPAVAVPAATPAELPEIVYWKQDLFLVPYQFGSTAEPGTAQAVWLLVSKDNGVNWRKVSEAAPQVKAFNYRAEGDGEYWFAIQTIDRYGRALPAGPPQPELRVVVDTTIPQIKEVAARQLDTGAIEIAARGSDLNLDPTTWKIEAQVDALGNWVAVPAVAEAAMAAAPAVGPPEANGTTAAVGESVVRAQWQPAAGVQPLAIRATVQDRAGNPTTYQTQIGNGSPQTLAAGVTQQPWSAAVESRAPFRLSTSGTGSASDGVTAYGMPAPPPEPGLTLNANAASTGTEDGALPDARYAGPVVRGLPEAGAEATDVVRGAPDPALAQTRETFGQGVGEVGKPAPNLVTAPHKLELQPFRQATVTRLPPSTAITTSHVPRTAPKLVGSRTFALEYDLEDAGRLGVAKVELWGTRDGGQNWHLFARDDDHRSPLVATVDAEGLYGFRIVVESAGSTAPSQPNPGDEPELWVQVDLDRPVIELTGMERGTGNLSDHLTLRWRASDDNLEPRPISLFYSSRPSGPWSAIATNLEDTGEYSWRVERHVPAKFYIRAEARDTAGNLAAFQTRESIDFSALQPSGKLRGATPVGPSAGGAVSIGGAYR